MARIVISAFLLCLAGSVALGDVPLPPDLKYVDPRVRFDGVEKHGDYVFHLRFLTFSGGPANTPYTLIEVKDEKPFQLNAQRRISNMALLAMEKKDFDKRAKDDPSLKWLTDKTAGVLSAYVSTPSTTGSVKAKEVPVTEYKVILKDGKLQVENGVKRRSDASEPNDARSIGRLPQMAFGIFTALALAFAGIWFVRSRRRHVAD